MCVYIGLCKKLDQNLSPVEFAYNDNYHATIAMAQFETIYGRSCKMLVPSNEIGERKSSKVELINQIVWIIKTIQKGSKPLKIDRKVMQIRRGDS